MRILAFDTATAATTVALLDAATDPPTVHEARDDPPAGARPGHTAQLLALIEEVLADSGRGWDDVDRLAVGIGPGTFTGLRIGIATAQALARARGIDLVGVSTLASLALTIRDESPESPLLPVLDARRGEVFTAAWGAGADPRNESPILEPSALGPEELARLIASLPAGPRAAGDGAVKFRAVLERAGASVAAEDSMLHRVSAREHCRLALGLTPGPPDAVLPMYLRLPDAELSRRE